MTQIGMIYIFKNNHIYCHYWLVTDVDSYDGGIGTAVCSLVEPSTGSVSCGPVIITVGDVTFVFLWVCIPGVSSSSYKMKKFRVLFSKKF